jgi:hypothetical protein
VPQFAVVTRSFRIVSDLDPERKSAVQINLGSPDRGPRNCLFESPKVYLVHAQSSEQAMRRVKRFAEKKAMQLIIHRAIEVSGTLVFWPSLP